MKSEAIYLYCLAHCGSLPKIEGTGIDGHPLLVHSFSDIAAVVSEVSLEQFCGPSAESRLQDLSWVGPRACCHEEVVEQVMRHSAVLPARFGTIFSSVESMGRCLEAHYAAILRFLDQVAHKEEWAVKGLLHRARAQEALLSTMVARLAGSHVSMSPGMRYFHERRLRADAEKELKGWLKEICREMANALGHYASDFRECKVLSLGTSRGDREMVFNWSFLVPKGAVADFHARLDRANADHAQEGIVFELSGPWPPYSFSPSLEMGSER